MIQKSQQSYQDFLKQKDQPQNPEAAGNTKVEISSAFNQNNENQQIYVEQSDSFQDIKVPAHQRTKGLFTSLQQNRSEQPFRGQLKREPFKDITHQQLSDNSLPLPQISSAVEESSSNSSSNPCPNSQCSSQLQPQQAPALLRGQNEANSCPIFVRGRNAQNSNWLQLAKQPGPASNSENT